VRHRPLTAWLALVVGLAVGVYFGGRALIRWYYPLHYRSILVQQASAHGLDPYLVAAVIRTESGFKPDATSSRGARGLMQIMPETGEWAARQLRLPFSPEMLYEPEYNIRLGCWYLASLRDEFGGDLVLSLAAYNAGRSNVKRWLDERQWTGESHRLDQIPFPETRHYVAKVLRDVERYRMIYASERSSGMEGGLWQIGSLTSHGISE
jgi:soluble lytic murein transglycosylase